MRLMPVCRLGRRLGPRRRLGLVRTLYVHLQGLHGSLALQPDKTTSVFAGAGAAKALALKHHRPVLHGKGGRERNASIK